MLTMSKATSIRLPDDLREKIDIYARNEHRSISNEIEELIRIGFAAKENPDLPLEFINDLLQAKAEKELGLAKPFKI